MYMTDDKDIINDIKNMHQEGKSEDEIHEYLAGKTIDITKADSLINKALKKKRIDFKFRHFQLQLWHFYLAFFLLVAFYIYQFSNEILVDISMFSYLLISASTLIFAVNIFFSVFIESTFNREHFSDTNYYLLGFIIFVYYNWVIFPLGINFFGSIILAGMPLHILFMTTYDLSLTESIGLIIFTMMAFLLGTFLGLFFAEMLLRIFM